MSVSYFKLLRQRTWFILCWR